MTYLKDGIEYLDSQEMKIFESIRYLSNSGRTTNNSQIAADTGIGRTTVANVTAHLSARGFITDEGKGAAYHWRIGGKTPRREVK